MAKSIINARGLGFRELNSQIASAAEDGAAVIEVRHAHGQRYIGTGLNKKLDINIYGTPGSDLAAFGNGPCINVYGNGQEAVGNTLNAGELIIHGHVNDVVGVSMRGGEIYVRDFVGYRAGIHMKAYRELKPAIVIGGTAQHFLGEYMAGGSIVVLGIGAQGGQLVGDYVGTGMHGGAIYLRGNVDKEKLGKEVSIVPLDDSDYLELRRLVSKYCSHFGLAPEDILAVPFTKLAPLSHRPYGLLYVS